MRKVIVFAALLAVVILSLVPQLALAQDMTGYKEARLTSPSGKYFCGFVSTCDVPLNASSATFNGFSQVGWLSQPYTGSVPVTLSLTDVWNFNAVGITSLSASGPGFSKGNGAITWQQTYYNNSSTPPAAYLHHNFSNVSGSGALYAVKETVSGTLGFNRGSGVYYYDVSCYCRWDLVWGRITRG